MASDLSRRDFTKGFASLPSDDSSVSIWAGEKKAQEANPPSGFAAFGSRHQERKRDTKAGMDRRVGRQHTSE